MRIFLLFTLMLPLAAQTATVTGKVSDDTGAGVPDLKVSLINQATKVEKEIRSSPEGAYTLEAAPGMYSVAVDKPGRGVFAVRDVELTAGAARTVNIELSARADNRNFRYMFYGFLAAWLVLVVYVLSLAGRERGLRTQIQDLKAMVESERR